MGVLGGSFNPPHLGHLVMASEAHAQLGLDRVLLVPAGAPPHKQLRDDPGGEVRLRLCELAVAGDARMAVDRRELDRPGPSYTVDTLRGLRDAGAADALTLVVGGDMAVSLPTWRDPEAILDLAVVAVAERAGSRREEIADRLASLRGADRVVFFDMPRLDVSSSDVRRRIREGRPIRYLVPEPVAGEIEARGLYRHAVTA